jgi:hypothetical protein
MRSFFVVLLCLGAAVADPESKPSGLKVEYLSKPDPCSKVARSQSYKSFRVYGLVDAPAK